MLEGDSQQSLLGTARPLIDRVDRETGRDRADVSQRQFDLVATDLLANYVENFKRDLLGFGDVRAVRCAQPQAELTDIDGREDFPAEATAERRDNPAAGDEVDEDDERAQSDEESNE